MIEKVSVNEHLKDSILYIAENVEKTSMFFGNFGLLQSSGKAGVVHVAERVSSAGHNAA